jgi:hypothetical protein
MGRRRREPRVHAVLWIEQAQHRLRRPNGWSADSSANAGALSTATWYLVCFWHDPVANQIGISIHGAASSTANTLSFAGGSYSSTSSFEIGKGEMNADIDELVILQGALLDSTERDELWNGGTGVAFADWAGGGGTNRRRRLLICGAAA